MVNISILWSLTNKFVVLNLTVTRYPVLTFSY